MSDIIEQDNGSIMERVIIEGNLKELSPEQRVIYYNKLCASLSLNPLTKPFEYMILNGKLTLYARKDATEQLRKIHGISIVKLESKVLEGCYVVTAYARSKDGREDVSTGAVTISNLKGDAFANAIMKAESKAKRRVTLSLGGLGMMDESEIETVSNVQYEQVEQKEPPSTSPLIEQIEHSRNKDELREVFNKAFRTVQGFPLLQEAIVIAKDKRKIELERMALSNQEYIDQGV